MPKKTDKIESDGDGRRRVTFEVNYELALMIEEMLDEQKHTGFRFRGVSETIRDAIRFYHQHGPWRVFS